MKLNQAMTTQDEQPHSDGGPVMRLQRFARLLDISTGTARQMVNRREIATVRLGKLIMIPRTEVDRLVAENTQPAA